MDLKILSTNKYNINLLGGDSWINDLESSGDCPQNLKTCHEDHTPKVIVEVFNLIQIGPE